MQCTNCGASLSAEQLSGRDCPYCGTALPTQVRAAEKVAEVEQLLADRNGNGIPDVFEGMMAGVGVDLAGQNVVTSSSTTVRQVSSEVVIVNGVVQSSTRTTTTTGGPMALPVSPALPPAAAPTTTSRSGITIPLVAVLLAVGLVALGVIALIVLSLR